VLLPDLNFAAQQIVWSTELEGDAQTLLSEVEEDSDDEPAKIEQAGAWLRDRLAKGSVAQVELEADARAEGLAWRTIKRAKAANGIVAEKNGMAGPWQWRLPRQRSEGGQKL
jgi:hypothetical protein